MALYFLYACTGSTPGDSGEPAGTLFRDDPVTEYVGNAPDSGAHDSGGTAEPDCVGESDFDGPETADWLFGTDGNVTVNAFELYLPPSSEAVLAALDDGSDDIVCGTLTTPYGVLANVGVRMRGKKNNSFQPLDGKPYLEVRTDKFVEGQTLSGLTRFRFYNQWEDQSGLQRYVGYQIWRDAGYPAPRAGFATLQLNGRDLGFYGTNEGVGESMLAEWPEFFPDPTANIYEGEYGNDLTGTWLDDLWYAEDLDADDAPALRDLATIVEFSDDIEADLPARMDPTLWHEHWALEMVVAAQEGYTNIQNNWYLVEDPGTGLATMIPWGFDQVLVNRNLMPDNPAGLLPLRGNQQADFFRKQCDALESAVGSVDWEGLRAELAELDARLPAEDAVEGLDRFEPVEIRQARASVDVYLQERPGELLAWHAANCPD